MHRWIASAVVFWFACSASAQEYPARAVRVIVPTNAVADDAVKELGIPRERIAVIPEAPAPKLRPRGADEVQALRERFGDERLRAAAPAAPWTAELKQRWPGKRVDLTALRLDRGVVSALRHMSLD